MGPKDGKYEVIWPVSLPDEGTFDWLDLFLEKNPQYTELSDRMIIDWVEKSGFWRNRNHAMKTSNDKPEMTFGIRDLDDGVGVRRILHAVASVQQRNFVIMEVKGNLIKEERQEMLSIFSGSRFKKSATIVAGEPNLEFKRKIQEVVLKQKQDAADKEFEVKKAEAARQKLFEQKRKELERAKKESRKAAKKAEAEKKEKA